MHTYHHGQVPNAALQGWAGGDRDVAGRATVVAGITDVSASFDQPPVYSIKLVEILNKR